MDPLAASKALKPFVGHLKFEAYGKTLDSLDKKETGQPPQPVTDDGSKSSPRNDTHADTSPVGPKTFAFTTTTASTGLAAAGGKNQTATDNGTIRTGNETVSGCGGPAKGKMNKSKTKADISGHIPPPLPLFQANKKGSSSTELMPPKTGIDAVIMWPPPKHILYTPPHPEPLVPPRATLLAEILRKEAARAAHPENLINRVVYDSIDPSPAQKKAQTAANNAKQKTDRTDRTDRPGGSYEQKLHPWYVPASPEDTVLVFESRFEGGNCRRAIQVYNDEYDLILKPDINTRGHTQWFYFECKNTRADRKYKFNIINLIKSDSLYNEGMRPLLYSTRLAEERKIGWHRCAEDICYYQNGMKRKNGSFYTCTFTVKFPHDRGTIYLAYCYPYSYTDLRRYLLRIEKDKARSKRFRRRPLCTTLAGNSCDLLTITTFGTDPEAMKSRKGVIVSARVHPGESNASWMMKGFIDYLTGPSLDARILRDNFVFKIVPMLNPDGVVVGNYRCSLAGIDLNRSYINPSRKLNPTIFYTKQMIKRFMQDREVVLSVDLHGHSRKMNVFIYGCENKHSPSLRLKERVFPRMLWKNASVFSFRDSSFKVQKSKETTARVVVWREIGLINSYTMEASFAGANFGRRKGAHFNARDLEQCGHCFCDTILDYCDPDQTKVHMTMRELDMLCPGGHSNGMESAGGNNEDEGSDVGSDSDWEAATAAAAAAAVKSGNKGGGGKSSQSSKKSSKKKRKKKKQSEKKEKGEKKDTRRSSTKRTSVVSAKSRAKGGPASAAQRRRTSKGKKGDAPTGAKRRTTRRSTSTNPKGKPPLSSETHDKKGHPTKPGPTTNGGGGSGSGNARGNGGKAPFGSVEISALQQRIASSSGIGIGGQIDNGHTGSYPKGGKTGGAGTRAAAGTGPESNPQKRRSKPANVIRRAADRRLLAAASHRNGSGGKSSSGEHQQTTAAADPPSAYTRTADATAAGSGAAGAIAVQGGRSHQLGVMPRSKSVGSQLQGLALGSSQLKAPRASTGHVLGNGSITEEAHGLGRRRGSVERHGQFQFSGGAPGNAIHRVGSGRSTSSNHSHSRPASSTSSSTDKHARRPYHLTSAKSGTLRGHSSDYEPGSGMHRPLSTGSLCSPLSPKIRGIVASPAPGPSVGSHGNLVSVSIRPLLNNANDTSPRVGPGATSILPRLVKHKANKGAKAKQQK